MVMVYWGRQAPILFPIVGQLKNLKTQIEGKNLRNVTTWFLARDMELKKYQTETTSLCVEI